MKNIFIEIPKRDGIEYNQIKVKSLVAAASLRSEKFIKQKLLPLK